MNYKDIRNLSNLYNNRKDKYDNYGFYPNKDVFISEEVPVNREVGYIELYVFTDRGQYPIPDALVTIYVRRGDGEDPVSINSLFTKAYPITFDLPVAHHLGTLIRGPEYYFTTYNINIEVSGYSPVRVLNIRIFPGIRENLDINMFELLPGVYPIPETIIDIPPHPRDIVNIQRF